MHLSKFKPRHLSICRDLRGLYIGSAQFQTHFSQSLSILLCLFTSQTHFFSLNTSFPRDFRPKDHLLSSSMIFFTHFIIHFMFSDLTFGICDKLWGFSKLMEFLSLNAIAWLFSQLTLILKPLGHNKPNLPQKKTPKKQCPLVSIFHYLRIFWE